LKETLSEGSYTQSVINCQTFPDGVGVDEGGNVYNSNRKTNYVLKESLSGNSYTESVITTSQSELTGLAVDQSGNLYVADVTSGRVCKFIPPAGNYTQSQVASNPEPVAVDGRGQYLSIVRIQRNAD
jgi:sugar lactone lactonase YvrE